MAESNLPYEKQPLPEWYDNTIGITDKAPKPFTPVKRQDNTISVWGRSYAFGKRLFPEQIATQGGAMLAGPKMAFPGAEEHGLAVHYGSRILVSIATGLEMGYGTSILTTLSREEMNLDGPVKKEIQTFIKKIGGGF